MSQGMKYTEMFLDCIFTVSTEHISRTAMQQLSLIKRKKNETEKEQVERTIRSPID